MSATAASLNERVLSAPDLIIVPTHDHLQTLGLAVRSVQNQTLDYLDIVVIGDGVNDDTRDALRPFLIEDPRISFIDRPKGVRHGEEYRDETIRRSLAQRVHYLGDDDLYFPDHVETMNELVDGVDFANSLPVFIHLDGTLTYVPTDLSQRLSLDWHLDPVERRNSVSLTGVTHTRHSYLRLPYGWRPAPPGRWTDHFMWEQYFQLDGFAARTSPRATTAKFNHSERAHLSGADRAQEVSEYLSGMDSEEFISTWNLRVASRVREHSAQSETLVTALRMQISELNTERQELTEQLTRSNLALEAMEQTFSWRITRPLRAMRSLQLNGKTESSTPS